VFKELQYIYSLGIKELFIKDQSFGADRARTIKLCAGMIEKNYNFSWSCFMRTDCIDNELLIKMKESGCHTIMLGVESANEDILKKYKKGINKQNIMHAFKLCKDIGINTMATFMLGFPEDNKESILETIDFAINLDCDFASFNIFAPKLPTPIWKSLGSKYSADKEAIPAMDQSGIAEICSAGRLSRKDLSKLRRIAVKSFYLRPSYIIKRLLKISSLVELHALIKNGFFLIKRGIFST